ncbi:hypothetical protein BO70DRAFT_394870 [Aspergillus heteromorphus CBS 117.55]|uniref:Uncharacterized protein n=1 Tax=Aspergillus heteromorphus CBS 117.55 TaxID=1448321 RepID=A0A317WP49_9EURO|nr:uncharacterized protein BO70DRAFT_394870 [Aspergillus heteromorphus CBS 117.55]PWY86857.1 hypothetical protein BO70DRAFT_394870 [Aspergillus heteromorphus CBS 117.55]
MRWTEDNKETLLRLIFETQSFVIELDKIADAWPGDEKPTTKALSEQLGKYRKPGCSVTFSAVKKGKGGGAESAPVTPRKRRKSAKAKSSPVAESEGDDQSADA